MSKSSIEWTEQTWNPTTGCDLISPGCDRCYAKTLSRRLMLMGQKKYKNNFQLTLHPDTLDVPRSVAKPQMWFVNSMSDLFHHRVPLSYIHRVFAVMRETPQHTYQVLTKRSGILLGRSDVIDWPPNVWMGVSIEAKKYLRRADHLRRTGAQTKFLSLEPLLEDLGPINLEGIDWVIVGGESGPGARPMHPDWARSVRNQCNDAGVPFFFKQWGSYSLESKTKPGKPFTKTSRLVTISGLPTCGVSASDVWMHRVGKGAAGAVLDGREWKEFPSA